jgi:outer membrane biosynthesis protein TonB
VDTDEQRKKVNRYVAISSALHVALFLLFSVGAIFAPRPIVVMPTIHVDMVALPTQVKNNDEPPPDFSKPVGPATPVVEEPKADPDQIAKPEPREATPKPQPVRPAVDEMVLERKKEAEAKKRAEAALKRMRDQLKKERLAEEQKKKAALEKRRADLKAFEQKYRQAVAGNTKNEGNALSGQLAATTDAYSSAVADRIRAHWALPTFLQGQNLKATPAETWCKWSSRASPAILCSTTTQKRRSGTRARCPHPPRSWLRLLEEAAWWYRSP